MKPTIEFPTRLMFPTSQLECKGKTPRSGRYGDYVLNVFVYGFWLKSWDLSRFLRFVKIDYQFLTVLTHLNDYVEGMRGIPSLLLKKEGVQTIYPEVFQVYFTKFSWWTSRVVRKRLLFSFSQVTFSRVFPVSGSAGGPLVTLRLSFPDTLYLECITSCLFVL